MFRKIWEIVKIKSEKSQNSRRREETEGKSKNIAEKRKEEETYKRKDDGSKEGSKGMGNSGQRKRSSKEVGTRTIS